MTGAAATDAVVVGGGLAGITAALDLAARGARVTLLERRRRLGGLTWSFRHEGRWIDNGQHVFLRCCHAYRGFLTRIGSDGDVELQPRLDVTAVRPGAAGGPPRSGTLRRNGLPAPLQLGASLLRYPLLSATDRLGVGRAALALRRLRLGDPALDTETFASWLGRHGQSPGAIAGLWDLITVATINLPAREASLAVAAKVFKTGLLEEAGAADIGWSRLPLGTLHGTRAAATLQRAGVDVRLGRRVGGVQLRAGGGPRYTVVGEGGDVPVGADIVVVAVPHTAAGGLLPPHSVAAQDRLGDLGTSAIVNVHLVYDRRVTDLPLLAGVDSPVQWVFDRTASSGLPGGGQYLAVSLSAADDLVGRHPDEVAARITAELARLLPAAARAEVREALVTKERSATFRAVPGSGALRPGPATAHAGLVVAGAWTATGWPATMEGAVRSGHAAAAAALDPPLDSTPSEEVA